MDSRTHHIRDHFADKKHILDLLMAEDPDFHTMCEDYNTCVNALQYWSKSNDPVAQDRVHEYRALVCELQEEIRQIINSPNRQKLV